MFAEKQPIIQILFFNGFEYYFEYNIDYKDFKTNGFEIKKLKNKSGTLCLKILSYLNEIISYIDNYEENLYDFDNNFNLIMQNIIDLKNDLSNIDNLLSKILYEEIERELFNRTTKISNLEHQLDLLKIFSQKIGKNAYNVQYNFLQEELKQLNVSSESRFAISLLDNLIYNINDTKLFIDYFYNLFEDYKIKKQLKSNDPNTRVYSLQSLYKLCIPLPSSEKILCIIDNNKLMPSTSYLLNKFSDEKKQEIEMSFDDMNLLNTGIIEKKEVYYAEVYNIYSLRDLLNASLNIFLVNNILISKCKNCGKYFIPVNKNNETLCDNIYKNRKNL